MTWVEDASKWEDNLCLQRQVTEVDVARVVREEHA